jgi:16S rRNA (cytosine967-C5)-methyltransferase
MAASRSRPTSAPHRPRRRPSNGRVDAAREGALAVLQRVRAGATWDQAWDGVDLDDASRDRRFAVDLAGGCLRLRARLDWLLEPLVVKGLQRLHPDVLDLLRLGAFQLLEERVPDHAAVSATVDVAKRRVPAASGLVNAVLRRLLRQPLRAFPDPAEDPVGHLVHAASHPEWIVTRWVQRFGFDSARSLCAWDNQRPGLRLRVNRCRTTRDTVLATLPGSASGAWSPWSVQAEDSDWSQVVPLLQQGLVSVQDESGMLVGEACGARRGETWVDVAASPGGKSGCLAESLGGSGRVIASDVGARKVARLAGLATRLGLDNIRVQRADARHLPVSEVDGVLVDAPCSGLGVLSRRPDARWRKQPSDLQRLPRLQLQLLQEAASRVRPGGTLVYSLCSFEPEETLEVTRAFEATHPEFVAEALPVPDALHAERGVLYLLPQEHRVDGGFVARWKRRSTGGARS